MSEPSPYDEDPDSDARLGAAIDEYLECRRRGEAPDPDAFVQRHPDIADELRELLPVIGTVEASGNERVSPGPPARTLGDYRILRLIGRGGMGVVYEAEQISLGRLVALKVLPAQATLDPNFLERFQREARAAAQLRHPHIVPVYGVGESDGTHFFAMQYIDGPGLDEVMRQARLWGEPEDRTPHSVASAVQQAMRNLLQDGTTIPVPHPSVVPATEPLGHAVETGADGRPFSDSTARTLRGLIDDTGTRIPYQRAVARIGLHVAEALAEAHGQGVLHRDIKPSNLLLDSAGKVWVSDFGLCKTEGSEDLTRSGDFLGTLRYMAPERFSGQSDVRSDVYGLGVTLYELLTLRPAFEGDDQAALVRSVLEDEPERPTRIDPDIPADLETIVLQAMRKRPGDRYATADALARDLRAFLDGRPITARAPTLTYLFWLAVRRNRTLAASVVVFLLLLMASTAIYIDHISDARDRAEEARRQAALQSYIARVGAAQAALRLHDVETASRHLAVAPPEFRHWEWRHVGSRLDHSLRVLKNPVGETLGACMAFSPDGRWIAAANGGRSFEILLLDAGSGALVRRLKGHRAWIHSLDISSDGRRLLSTGSQDRTARLWNLETGELIRTMRGHLAEVNIARFSPDGRWIATGSMDRRVMLRDPESGQRIKALEGHDGRVTDIDFNADSSWLVTGSSDRTVRVWDLVSGETVHSRHDLPSAVRSVEFSPDGSEVAVGCEDGSILLWAPGGNRATVLRGHEKFVRNVAFDPSNPILASNGADHTVRLWDRTTGQELAVLQGPAGPPGSLCFHPEGEVFATCGLDIRIWSATPASSDPLMRRHLAGATEVMFTARGRLVSSSRDTTLRVWDPVTGDELVTLLGQVGRIHDAGVARDAEIVVSGGQDGEVRLWHLDSSESSRVARETGRTILAVALNDDASRVAAGYDDGTLRAWRSDGDGSVELSVHTEQVSDVRFLDASTVVSTSHDGTLLTWDVVSSATRRVDTGVPVRALDILPGTTRAVTGHADGSVRFWDLERLGEITGFDAHRTDVRALAFHPDGDRIASGGQDGAVRIWTWPGGELVASLPMVAWIIGLSFDREGDRLAASASNGDLHIWDDVSAATRFGAIAAAQSARRRAAALVDELLWEEKAPDAALAALEARADLDPDVRAECLRLLRTRGGTVEAFRTDCWRRVREPGAEPDALMAALERMRAVVYGNRRSESARDHVLFGAAAYRNGQYGPAVDHLTRARQFHEQPDAVCLAFLAMAQARRGQLGPAEATLEELGVLLTTTDNTDPDAHRLLREAEGVIEELRGKRQRGETWP